MKLGFLRALALLTFTFLLTSIAYGSGVIRYVNKASVLDVEDGLSWETAFRSIQAAIDNVYSEGGGEVWIAAGIYDEPRQSEVPTDTTGTIDTGSLVVREGVAIFGGFSGNEEDLGLRDWSQNETVVDGSTARDGTNALHVVIMEAATQLDGLHIQGGYASRNPDSVRYAFGGAGLRTTGKNVTIRNCTFRDNISHRVFGGGAAIGTQGISASFENCQFIENEVIDAWGGAVMGSAKFEKCVFKGNVASDGAALSFSDAEITTCVFEGNGSARQDNAGAVVNVQNSATIRGCTFMNNETDVVIEGANRPMLIANSVFWNNRGTAVYGRDSEIRDNDFPVWHQVVNCTFASPPGADVGPAFDLVWRARVALTNSIVWGHGSEPIQTEAGAPLLVARHSIIEGGFDGTAVLDADPQFADLAGGDLRLVAGSPGIDAGIAEAAFGHPPFPAAPEADLDGRPRPLGAAVDLGAYEYVPADVNGDGEKNAIDLQLVVNAALRVHEMPACDLNGDGTADAIDVQLMTNALLGVI